jgi:replicative DNA helicase
MDFTDTAESPPNTDILAEQQVLGAVLLEPECLSRVSPLIVLPEDMHDPKHALILDAMLCLDADSVPVDIVSVSQALKAMHPPRLQSIGGSQYLADLTDMVGSTANVERNAQSVATLARVRRGVNAAKDIIALSGQALKPEDLMAAAEKIHEAVRGREVGKLVHIMDDVLGAFARIEAMDSGAAPDGVMTGYRDLDNLLKGMRNGKVYTIAARPRVGKSALLIGLALGLAQHGAAALFSMEMPRTECVDRALCWEARVDNQAYAAGRVDPDSMDRLTVAASKLCELPIYINDADGLTPSEVKAQVKLLQKSKKVAAVLIDYVQLMRGDSKTASRELEISSITRALKSMAKSLDVPVIILAQLNRSPEKRGKDAEPLLSDLRESGGIENDSDVVAFLQRPEVDAPEDESVRGKATLIVKKHRGGPPGKIDLIYQAWCGRFLSAAPDYMEESA